MVTKEIHYDYFYQCFVDIVKNENHCFITPRQVGMTTCGINYILKYCSDNKTNGVYFIPNEKCDVDILRKKNVKWYGWLTYRKNIIRKNGNTIYITNKFDEICYSYRSLGIKIFIFDNISFNPKFPKNINFLEDKNVKCIFLETSLEENLTKVKHLYKNILNNKNLKIHFLTINDFLNIKQLLRKSKIEEIFGDITI